MTHWTYDGEWVSTQNPTIKRWAQLKQRHDRTEQGLMILEGPHVIEEALLAGIQFEQLLVGARGEHMVPYDQWKYKFGHLMGKIMRISDAVMDKLSDAKTPQGILAICPLPAPAPEHFWQSATAVMAFDGLTDPGNLGTIIRSAAAFGVDGIWLGEGCVDLFHPKTIRATQGAIFHLPYRQAPLHAAFQTASTAGSQWLALTPRDGMPLDAVDAVQNCWWVIGSEAHGVQEALAGGLAQKVSIPMNGRTESLNAAMAATIALYEMNRQRKR